MPVTCKYALLWAQKLNHVVPSVLGTQVHCFTFRSVMVTGLENLGWLISTLCACLDCDVDICHISSVSAGKVILLPERKRKLHCSHLVAVISDCCIISLLPKGLPCPPVVPCVTELQKWPFPPQVLQHCGVSLVSKGAVTQTFSEMNKVERALFGQSAE